MHSDQTKQAKQFRATATVLENKLLLEINDTITYKGEIESSPYYDINQLKSIFQKGQIQVLVKTTSKMTIKLAILKIQLQSEETKKLDELKKRIQQLEDKLKNAGQGIEQDLDSKANFDMDCMYKINTNGGWTLFSTGVSAATIHFNYSGTNYSTSSSNRRGNTTGWGVTKMVKFRL